MLTNLAPSYFPSPKWNKKDDKEHNNKDVEECHEGVDKHGLLSDPDFALENNNNEKTMIHIKRVQFSPGSLFNITPGCYFDDSTICLATTYLMQHSKFHNYIFLFDLNFKKHIEANPIVENYETHCENIYKMIRSDKKWKKRHL